MNDVVCPTCGAVADHDGIGRCSLIIATLRGQITDLEADIARYRHRPIPRHEIDGQLTIDDLIGSPT